MSDAATPVIPVAKHNSVCTSQFPWISGLSSAHCSLEKNISRVQQRKNRIKNKSVFGKSALLDFWGNLKTSVLQNTPLRFCFYNRNVEKIWRTSKFLYVCGKYLRSIRNLL